MARHRSHSIEFTGRGRPPKRQRPNSWQRTCRRAGQSQDDRHAGGRAINDDAELLLRGPPANGYVFLAEESPEFIAKNLVSRLRQYAETLKTPFFGALVDYAENGNQPGHNGGIFYSRSPIGRIFMELRQPLEIHESGQNLPQRIGALRIYIIGRNRRDMRSMAT
jgi:Orn/Lys/Arg decarboxylase, major domain